MSNSLSTRPWWTYIQEDLQELLNQSLLLIQVFADGHHDGNKFHDYSFVVFPAAKAYEGFLKKIFQDLGFISEEDFYGKRFRIGRALNPALESDFRGSESVYDKMVSFCQGRELPDVLWETWKSGRNMLFHWFPNESNALDFIEAKKKVDEILSAMDLAFKECKLNST